MADGTERPIESLQAGNMVLSADIDGLPRTVHGNDLDYFEWSTERLSFKPQAGRVKRVIRGSEPFHYVINGTKVTAEHPYLSRRDGRWRFVRADQLKVGDQLVAEGYELRDIQEARRVDEPVETCNLTIAEYDVFYAAGVLVHNTLTSKGSSQGSDGGDTAAPE